MKEKENFQLALEKQQRKAEEMREDHQLEIELRERRLLEAREAEEEARMLAKNMREEGEEKERVMQEKEARLHFEQVSFFFLHFTIVYLLVNMILYMLIFIEKLYQFFNNRHQ